MGPLTVTGGAQCHVSILRNNNVTLSNLRNGHVTLSNLRNCHVLCQYFLLKKKKKKTSHVTKPPKGTCRRVDLGVYSAIYMYIDHLFRVIDHGCLNGPLMWGTGGGGPDVAMLSF